MSEKKRFTLTEEDLISSETDDSSGNEMEDLPPAYSSIFDEIAANSPLPVLEDDEKPPAAFENGRFSIDLRAGSHTSTVFQTFAIPAQSPRVVDVAPERKPTPPSEGIEDMFEQHGVLLDIVMMLVGNRYEIRACISVGRELQMRGHRVRVVTHSIFQNLVKKLGLEFFSASTDPEHSIARQDSGLMPGLASPNRTEVKKNSKMLLDTLKACWNACILPGQWRDRPFFADAIIATPLAHAHIHCAERLSIPLHIMSTTPWTPTKIFAHPLAQMKLNDGVDREIQNYLSHLLVEESVWNEIYYVVDHFRRTVLGLSQIPLEDGEGLLRLFDVPHTYLVSSALIPRPEDWSTQIDISGYAAEDRELSYTPPEDLLQFLEATVAPIYVSVHVDLLRSPEKFIHFFKEASAKYGFRFLLPSHFQSVSGISDPNIFVLHGVPINWLMPKIEMLITHGDADMVSMGLRHGKPMITLPVIRDQPFWANAVAEVGAGPIPIHEQDLSAEAITEAIRHCLQPGTRKVSNHIKECIENEGGLNNAVNSFYRHFKWQGMQCSIVKTSPAVYQLEREEPIKLSAAAAAVLVRSNAMRRSELKLIKRHKYDFQHAVIEVPPELATSDTATKSLGKKMVKAIVKPTISHIASAYNELESRDDSDTAGAKKTKEKSKTGMAVGVAKSAGFVSAVFLGKVAMLPFKTVYYMGETVSYGVKSLQGLSSSEGEKISAGQNDTQVASELEAESSIDDRLTTAIRSLQFEKGTRDERLCDPGFTKTVLSRFEDICKSNLIRS